MVITKRREGVFMGGEISVFRLTNSKGYYAEVCNFGATLTSLIVPDSYGKADNIILSYDKTEDYLRDTFYLGSTIGRFANRIACARFELDGELFHLDRNDGKNSNHGGFNAFNRKLFDSEICEDRLILSTFSPDGENGFPGNLQLSVSLSFSEENELEIIYKATSDRDTWFNPTCHAYFNLNQRREKTILEHRLQVFAEAYLESDSSFIPTGRILPVSDSCFDFREYRVISRMSARKTEETRGYNTCFCVLPDDGIKKVASLSETGSGRVLDVWSDMPGLMVYTGDYLDEPFCPLAGIALEAQFYPDTPNHPEFPSCLLPAGEKVVYTIRFRAGVSPLSSDYMALIAKRSVV